MLESGDHCSVTLVARSIPVISVLVQNLAQGRIKVHLLCNKSSKTSDLPRRPGHLLTDTTFLL
jgi:hypothetical protein